MEPEEVEEIQDEAPVEATGGNDESAGGGGNPAWQSFLDVLPTQLHPTVTPVLQQWDKGVQDRFNELHSQYEPYKPYEEIIKAGVDPQNIEWALGIMQKIDEDPRSVYDALKKEFGADWEDVVSNAETPEPGDEGYVDPEILQLRAVVSELAQREVSREENAKSLQQDKVLDDLMTNLHETHGDFDEGLVLALMAQDVKPEDAIARVNTLVEQAVEASKRPAAPKIMSHGGVASPPVIPANMNSKNKRELVAQMLQNAANAQN